MEIFLNALKVAGEIYSSGNKYAAGGDLQAPSHQEQKQAIAFFSSKS